MTGVEIDPSDHPKAEVRRVLSILVGDQQWVLRKSAHWGKLYCPCGCTTIPVSGTPRNASWHAKRIQRTAARCPLPDGDPRRTLTGMDR